MLWPALAISSILLLTIVFLSFSIEFRINEAIAKKCTDESMDNETTSSCGSQEESNTFTPSLQGSDSNTKDVNNDGGMLQLLTQNRNISIMKVVMEIQKMTPHLPYHSHK